MKVVLLWLVNEHGQILLAQREAHMSSDAGMWGPSVSGKVDAGETTEQAALREANEELGLDTVDLVPLQYLHDGRHDHLDGRLREFTIYYASVKASIISKIVLAPREVAAVKWVTYDELQAIYKNEPDTLIISSNHKLWDDKLLHLKEAVKNV